MSRRLMCIVAHPDDECYGFGGALALSAKSGVETSVLCLTDGQAATNRGSSADANDLGRMRREEFVASCNVLGVAQHEFLDYSDAKLEFANLHEAGRKLVQRMRIFKPQVVITFGLDGGLNVHADHTSVSAMASAAFHWAARAKRYPDLGLPPYQPQRLFHLSTVYFLEDREPLLPAPWTAALDITSVTELKNAAFRQHTSQLPVYDKVKPLWEKYGDREYYTLVATVSPQQMPIITDLFDGVDSSL